MSNIDQERLDKGLYWQRAFKLVEGCTKVSPGCDNCWSESETAMRSHHPNSKISIPAQQVLNDSEQFRGKCLVRDDRLEIPLQIRKPTVFAIWNDLYHEDVTDEFRDKAYAVMSLCPQHTFLVLTKRAQRMAEYWLYKEGWWDRRLKIINTSEFYCKSKEGDSVDIPLSNVWHGVTVENQDMADQRIPHLLDVPGKRFLSIEPMLGAIDFERIPPANMGEWCGFGPSRFYCEKAYSYKYGIHAVLLGGESGKNARPMHPDWVRSVRDQCEAAGVPFMFKQWGEWVDELHEAADPQNQKVSDTFITLRDKGTDYIDLYMCRVGKKKAGRTLDGILHDNLPWCKS